MATPPTPKLPVWEYRWFLRSVLPQYHGKLCRIVTAGDQDAHLYLGYKGKSPQPSTAAPGSWGQWRGQIIVEFADGVRVTCTRVAIKRLRSARGAWTGR